MQDYFPFLKKEGVFFLDTSCFRLHPSEIKHLEDMHEKRRYTIDSLREEAARLRLLGRKLKSMDNWVTVKDVIEEYEKQNKKLSRLQDIVASCRNLGSAVGELIDQRTRVLELMYQEHVNASDNLNERLSDRVDWLVPNVKGILSLVEKKEHESDTDCMLISTALAFAESENVVIYSHDYPLMFTFAYLGTNIRPRLKNTYVIDEIVNKIIGSREFIRSRKERLRVPVNKYKPLLIP